MLIFKLIFIAIATINMIYFRNHTKQSYMISYSQSVPFLKELKIHYYGFDLYGNPFRATYTVIKCYIKTICCMKYVGNRTNVLFIAINFFFIQKFNKMSHKR